MAKILVIEHDPGMSRLLEDVLTCHGHEVHLSTTEEGAFDLLSRVNPVVAVFDMAMPGQNGVQVLIDMRAIAPDLVMIVLTDGDPIHVETQLRELGVRDFIRRGLPMHFVAASVSQAAIDRNSLPSKAEGAGLSDGYSERILVVDDEPLITELIGKFMRRRGYQVSIAHDGESALALVREQKPRLVILDFYMPGMDGLQVLRALNGEHFQGRVIILTAGQDESVLEQTLDLGAVDVLSKPVDLDRLELVVLLGFVLQGNTPPEAS